MSAGSSEHPAANHFARPYVAFGEFLPPVCTAGELRSDILVNGTRTFLKDSDITTVLAALEKDNLPIPASENRDHYCGDDHAAYWLFGLDDFIKVRRAAESLGVAANKVLDFGGSTGRVYRHFYTQGWSGELYASDFNQVAINWCRLNFPSEMKIFLNSILPSLPFPDAFFDVITGFSVFTHIDEFEDAWLLELSRMLRPGGLAYLTIHDENTWMALATHIPLLANAIAQSPQGADIVVEPGMSMPFGRQAFHHASHRHYSCNVFHSSDYVRKFWGRYFQVESIEPFGHQVQAVVVVRKRF